jgi:ribosome-associated protein
MSESEKIKDLVVTALEDVKAVDIKVVDVRGKTGVTDFMIVASGNSDRHVKALSDNVIEQAKKNGHSPFGVEGEQACEWVLVDLVDVVVHIMLPRARDFYQLEKLWAPGVDRAVAG